MGKREDGREGGREEGNEEGREGRREDGREGGWKGRREDGSDILDSKKCIKLFIVAIFQSNWA